MGRLKNAVIVLIILFAAAQLVRPSHANPPTDASRAIQAHVGTNGLAPILDRACGDCHSNRTAWPWYTQVAPLSWLMSAAVARGRQAVNFSEWGTYSPERQRQLLSASCRAVSDGKMPGSAWTTLHPEARLSAQDLQTLCAAAQQLEAQATR